MSQTLRRNAFAAILLADEGCITGINLTSETAGLIGDDVSIDYKVPACVSLYENVFYISQNTSSNYGLSPNVIYCVSASQHPTRVVLALCKLSNPKKTSFKDVNQVAVSPSLWTTLRLTEQTSTKKKKQQEAVDLIQISETHQGRDILSYLTELKSETHFRLIAHTHEFPLSPTVSNVIGAIDVSEMSSTECADWSNSLKLWLHISNAIFLSVGQILIMKKDNRVRLFEVSKSEASGERFLSIDSRKVKSITIESSRFEQHNNASSAYRGFAKLGGLGHVKEEIDLLILFPLLHPHLFFKKPGDTTLIGIKPPRGLLMYGAPGTGKSFLAEALKEELGLRWTDQGEGGGWQCPVVEFVQPSNFITDNQDFARIFTTAADRFANEHRTTLLFIDEIDGLCPKRSDTIGEAERRMLTLMLMNLDGPNAHPGVVILAATNRPDDLDPAIRRPGRLDKELELGVGDATERTEMLLRIAKNVAGITLSNEQASKLAFDAHGFVAADLVAWSREAYMRALKRSALETSSNASATFEDFQETRRMISPTALKEMRVERPNTRWSDIGGYESVKMALKESVEWPIKYAEVFRSFRVSPPRGILLYGPPGNSKTIMAKAVARESSMNFIAVKGPELFSKYVGESERAVRTLFRKARQNAPCIIFFDEIDSVAIDRRNSTSATGVEARVLSQILNEMDGIGPIKEVIIIAATNRPDLLDAALMRPGRFDRILYVPLPDIEARREIIRIHGSSWLKSSNIAREEERDGNLKEVKETDGVAETQDDELLEWMAKETEGYSGAEIAYICREIVLTKLRVWVKTKEESEDNNMNEGWLEIRVVKEDIQSVLNDTKPRTPSDMLQFYEDFSKKMKEGFRG